VKEHCELLFGRFLSRPFTALLYFHEIGRVSWLAISRFAELETKLSPSHPLVSALPSQKKSPMKKNCCTVVQKI